MRTYNGVLVGKGSQLEEALELKKGSHEAAEKVFAETTKRYKQLFKKEDREWFENWGKN